MYYLRLFVLIPFLAVSLAGDCSSLGSVRVDNGADGNSYIQVCIQNNIGNLEWAFICGELVNEDPWGYDNAYVWCRSRGLMLTSDMSLGSISELNHSSELKLSNVTCNRAYNKSIIDCQFRVTTEPCRYLHGVLCKYCNEGSDCNSPGHCNEEDGMCLCSDTCQNGGFCDLGRCQCTDYFYGDKCENMYCTTICSNGGSCLQDGRCQCQSGHYGDTCQHKECSPNCQNGSPCLTNGTCDCSSPFYGDSCEHKECTQNCQNGFSCLTNGTCDCSYPFYGDSCQNIACVSSCLNGGDCLDNGTCQCQASFYGDVCEFKLCTNSCRNGGECNVSTGLCTCPSIFYGNRCELMECTTNCEPTTETSIQNNMLIIIISFVACISIATLLALILITSICLVAVAIKNMRKLPTSAKSLGLKNLREPQKIPEEPIYEYLDGSSCSQYLDMNRVATTQFLDSYASNNIYEYAHFPVNRQMPACNRTPSKTQSQTIGISYNNIDSHHYETPFPIKPASISDDVAANTESYVRMYPVSSCPSLK